MHVKFEFTQDDLIDASKRFSARLKAVRSFQWNGLLATAFLAWLLFFVFLYRTPIQGAIIGLIAAGLTALFYPGSNRKAVDKRMRKIFRELFSDANSFLCEVELRAFRNAGPKVRYSIATSVRAWINASKDDERRRRGTSWRFSERLESVGPSGLQQKVYVDPSTP